MALKQLWDHHGLLQFILRGGMIVCATFHEESSKVFQILYIENPNENIMVALK